MPFLTHPPGALKAKFAFWTAKKYDTKSGVTAECSECHHEVVVGFSNRAVKPPRCPNTQCQLPMSNFSHPMGNWNQIVEAFHPERDD